MNTEQRVAGPGWSGRILSGTPGGPGELEIELKSGKRVSISADALSRLSDGTFYVPLRREALDQAESGQPVAIPLAREDFAVQKRVRETSRTIVRVSPVEHSEVVDVPLFEERIEVERRPLGQIVDGPQPAREEDGVTIIPVYEEVLVVQKKLRLKEEIRIHRERTVRHEKREVMLREEVPEIRRVKSLG